MAGGKHLLGMKKGRYVFGTAKVGEKGQIVIPKEARQHYNIQTGDTLLILGDDENGMIVTRPEILDRLASQIMENLNQGEYKDEYRKNV